MKAANAKEEAKKAKAKEAFDNKETKVLKCDAKNDKNDKVSANRKAISELSQANLNIQANMITKIDKLENNIAVAMKDIVKDLGTMIVKGIEASKVMEANEDHLSTQALVNKSVKSQSWANPTIQPPRRTNTPPPPPASNHKHKPSTQNWEQLDPPELCTRLKARIFILKTPIIRQLFLQPLGMISTRTQKWLSYQLKQYKKLHH